MVNPSIAHFNFGRLAVVHVRNAANSDGNWVFKVVPVECDYTTLSRGELRVEVGTNLLPDDFHSSNYMPAHENYRIIEMTGKIKRVSWLSGHPNGIILIEATEFRDTTESITCPAE
jgi:hypothetical protein